MQRFIALWVGLRYLSAKRRNNFISFISLFSIIGMTLGVCVLIIVLSVMNGFDRELKERILGMVPHGEIYKRGGIHDWQGLVKQIKQQPHVLEAAPFTRLQGMLGYSGRVKGTMVIGIDPQAESRVSILPNFIKQGELADLKDGSFGVFLGDILARQLRVEVGDKITLLLPQATLSPAGVLPRIKRLTIKGIFSVGAELDGSLALVNLADAKKLGRLNFEAQAIRVKFDDLFKAPKGIQSISEGLGFEYYGSDWTRTQGNLFSAIKMEKAMIALLLLIIVAVAAFNIVSTLVIAVTDKQADIAILRTMGASKSTIRYIFIVQGLSIGLIGVTLGALLGIGGALVISDFVVFLERLFNFELFNANVYFVSFLPSYLKWEDVLYIVSAGLIISLLTTIYPSYKAASIEPAEALRYE